MLVILVGAFVVARIFNLWLAFTPTHYGAAAGDLAKYQTWAAAMTENRINLYSDVQIEYPPGVLPFLAAAEVIRADDSEYGHGFIWVMALLDVAGFAGVLVLSARWGARWGPWVWIVAIVLLGPIVYLRLDLIPAVATIWALERASAGGWVGAGGWLGFGAVAKVYPLFLLLPVLQAAPRSSRVLGGAALIGGSFLLPIVVFGSWQGLVDSVFAYHFERGIQVESTWGFLLLGASRFGHEMHINFQFGALEAASSMSRPLETLGSGLAVAALLGGWWAVRRGVKKGDVAFLTAGLFGTLALLMFFGTVFSPQFAVWLVALAAAGLCHPLTGRLRWALLSVLPIALLTQIVFPFTIGDVVAPFFAGGAEAGSTGGLAALGARNLLVLIAGAAALFGLRAGSRRDDARPAG